MEIMEDFEQYLYWKRASEKDMTYILGAKCKDGIVLIGDTKITIEGGTDFSYDKKIIVPIDLNNVVMGSAGAGGLFEEFQRRIQTRVKQIVKGDNKSNKLYINTEDGFLTLITKVIREMHNDYKNDSYKITRNLMILCATRLHPQSKLTAFYGDGSSEIVNDIRVIGHGEPYGSLFHKQMWNKNMNMKQTARLGIFIIKLIKDVHLDESVGYNEDYLPQVVFIPNVIFPKEFPKTKPINLSKEEIEKFQNKYNRLLVEYPISELTDEEIDDIIKENEPKIEEFGKFIKKLL